MTENDTNANIFIHLFFYILLWIGLIPWYLFRGYYILNTTINTITPEETDVIINSPNSINETTQQYEEQQQYQHRNQQSLPAINNPSSPIPSPKVSKNNLHCVNQFSQQQNIQPTTVCTCSQHTIPYITLPLYNNTNSTPQIHHHYYIPTNPSTPIQQSNNITTNDNNITNESNDIKSNSSYHQYKLMMMMYDSTIQHTNNHNNKCNSKSSNSPIRTNQFMRPIPSNKTNYNNIDSSICIDKINTNNKQQQRIENSTIQQSNITQSSIHPLAQYQKYAKKLNNDMNAVRKEIQNEILSVDNIVKKIHIPQPPPPPSSSPIKESSSNSFDDRSTTTLLNASKRFSSIIPSKDHKYKRFSIPRFSNCSPILETSQLKQLKDTCDSELGNDKVDLVNKSKYIEQLSSSITTS